MLLGLTDQLIRTRSHAQLRAEVLSLCHQLCENGGAECFPKAPPARRFVTRRRQVDAQLARDGPASTYLTAVGLIGPPTLPVNGSGLAEKKVS